MTICALGRGNGTVVADLLQASSAAGEQTLRDDPLAPRPHFASKVNSVIWLFMEGGPRGVDLLDRKPQLEMCDGQKSGIDIFNGDPGPLMKSPFGFKQYGVCGAWEAMRRFEARGSGLRANAGMLDEPGEIRDYDHRSLGLR